jgi:uncharacterized protein (DUF1800 family)
MSDSTPLTPSDARHLLRRTGFGARASDLEKLLKKFPTRGAAADSLITFKTSRFKPGGRFIDDVHNKWVKYMVKTRLQLQEKLVLFWHDHFATSFEKVEESDRMAKQNRLLRSFCKGNFKDFVKAINKDPAMMKFLDTKRNHKKQPNENYPRELMELLTLGVEDPFGNPNYDQADIVQIARAFTGWDYDKDEAVLDEGDHDKGDGIEGWNPPRGPKVIFKTRGGFNDAGGQSFDMGGNYAAEIDRVIDIIFQHRYGAPDSERSSVADYIAQRLITYFAHPDPDPTFVHDIVDQSGFASSWDIAGLLKAMFVHDDFYLSAGSPAAGVKKSVKWPIDFVVGTLRMLNMKLKSGDQYVNGGSEQDIRGQLTNMGQVLFEPPSVFGWDWETAWLSSSTLLARYAFARDVTGARGAGRTAFRPERLVDLTMTDPGDIVDAVTALLGVDDYFSPGSAERTALIDYLTDGAGAGASVDLSDETVRGAKLNGLVATVLQSPVYQLH